MHNKTHPTPSMINEKILLIEYVLGQIYILKKYSIQQRKLTRKTVICDDYANNSTKHTTKLNNTQLRSSRIR